MVRFNIGKYSWLFFKCFYLSNNFNYFLGLNILSIKICKFYDQFIKITVKLKVRA